MIAEEREKNDCELLFFFMGVMVVWQHLSMSSYSSKYVWTKRKVDECGSYVYKSSKSDKSNAKTKMVVFLSGGAQLKFNYFIQKWLDDLIGIFHLDESHDIFVYENLTNLNYKCIDFISAWLSRKCGSYEEIVVCGLSNGGCIGSHVVSSLEDVKCNVKLITIDSIINMFEMIKYYEGFKFYRPDIVGCYMTTYFHSLSHTHLYNKLNLFDVFLNTNRKQGLLYFEKMYDLDPKTLRYITTMNLDFLLRDHTRMVNIYSHYDPITIRKQNKKDYAKLIRKYGEKCTRKISNCPIRTVTHNSQMVDPHYSIVLCELFIGHL